MTTIHITGWRRGLLPISFVKAIRKATGEGLAPAKDKLDRLLAGESLRVEINDDQVQSFIVELDQIGAIASISTQ